MSMLKTLELDMGEVIERYRPQRSWPQRIRSLTIEPRLTAFFDDGSEKEFTGRETVERLILAADAFLLWRDKVNQGHNAGLPCPSLPEELRIP